MHIGHVESRGDEVLVYDPRIRAHGTHSSQLAVSRWNETPAEDGEQHPNLRYVQ